LKKKEKSCFYFNQKIKKDFQNHEVSCNIEEAYLEKEKPLQMPRKLSRHWKEAHGLEIDVYEAGIYYIRGDGIMMQLIVTEELSEEENLYLKCLNKKLPEELPQKLVAAYGILILWKGYFYVKKEIGNCKEKILDSILQIRYDNQGVLCMEPKEESAMEKIIEQGILYDFYGPLLTAHQQEIYEEAVYNNLSLGEIAEEEGISRQGVHDLIKRCDKILIEYEEKLHLVERFTKSKKQLDMIKTTAHKLQKNNSEDATIILQCVDEILEEL